MFYRLAQAEKWTKTKGFDQSRNQMFLRIFIKIFASLQVLPFNHAGLFSARLEMRNFQSTLPQQPAHSSLFWLVMFLSEIDEKITLSLINAGILKILCTINCVPIVSVVVV